MDIKKARAIFEKLESAEYSVEEKTVAIYEIVNMETHNSITKKQLIEALKWLFQKFF